ncbi:MAG: PD40 domain-containing protein [Verrucomicrobia bacterium]|nr:PD40 domain-containing protein [Verrucomicrobiota bacterium]
MRTSSCLPWLALTLAASLPAAPDAVITFTRLDVRATSVSGQAVQWVWTWPLQHAGDWGQVFPDGTGGFHVLATGTSNGVPIAVALDGRTGALLWERPGIPVIGHEDPVANQVLYADPVAFPRGLPKLGGSPTPEILLSLPGSHFGGTSSRVLCVDGATGQVLWEYVSAVPHLWGSGFVPDANGDGLYDVVIRSEPSGEAGGVVCLSGADGASVVWGNGEVGRGGVTVPDVTGDGAADFVVGQCCYDDRVFLLDGQTGATVWQQAFGAFDVLGVKRLPGTLDVVVAAQGSWEAGGVRRYQGATGQSVWACDARFNNQTMAGLVPVPGGHYVLSGWRGVGKVVCLDAATGATIWHHIPASDADHIGAVVPDQDGDGYGEVLIVNQGVVTLYSTAEGRPLAEVAGMAGAVGLAWMPPSAEAFCYTEDFSTPPDWQTDDPAKLHWDAASGTFQGAMVNTEGTFACVSLPGFAPNHFWRLTFDHIIRSNDWSAGLTFGLFDSRHLPFLGACLDMGEVDLGMATYLHANGQSVGTFDPPWQTGVWYRTVIEFNPATRRVCLRVSTRDTGQPLCALTLTETNLPPDITYFGVSRAFMKDTLPGADPAAAVHFSLDNIQLCATDPALPVQPLGEILVSTLRATNIWILNTLRQDITVLSPACGLDLLDLYQPVWSPDGRWVAFHASDFATLSGQIYLVRPDGSECCRVSDGTGSLVNPDFSPDGSRLAFNQEFGDVYTLSARCGATDLQTIPTTPGWSKLRWSPDGHYLASAAIHGGDIYLYEFATGIISNLTERLASPTFHEVVWSPDGSLLATMWHDPEPAPWDTDIVMVTRDGNEMVNLTPDWFDSEERSPTWSPDGRFILFLSNRGGNWNIWAMRPDGTGRTRLTDTPEDEYTEASMKFMAPAFTVAPTNQTVSAGTNVRLEIGVIGTGPLTIQWLHHGLAVPHATNRVLFLRGVSAAEAGAYCAVVEGPGGAVTNCAASVSLLNLQILAALEISGVAGATYRIQYMPDMNHPSDWMTLTDVVLPSSPYLWVDRQSHGQPSRFYRAVLLSQP